MGINITTSLLQTLNTTVVAKFVGAFDGESTFHEDIVAMVPSGSTSNTYPFAINDGQVREWSSGDRMVRSLALGSYQIFNKRYELTAGINRDFLADDMTGMLMLKVADMGRKFKKHPSRLLTSALLANPKGLDGVALFGATHPTNPAAPDGNTYRNDFGTAADGNDWTFNSTNLAKGIAKMRSLIGPDGEPLDVQPTHVLIPPALEYTARTAIFGAMIPSPAGTAPQSNVLQGIVKIIVAPHLATSVTNTDGDTTWYLIDSSTEDRAFFLQERDPLEFVARFNPEDPAVFERNEYVWGGTYRVGLGPGTPYRIARFKP